MKNILFLVLTFLIYNQNIYAQLKKTFEIEIYADFFSVDKTGNFYFVKNDLIIKTDGNFNKIAEYSDKQKGDIGTIDALDPLRLLVFYPQINSIVFLDKFLTPLRSAILLDDLQLFSTMAVSSSNYGIFRIFDARCNCLIMPDLSLKNIQKGTNINTISEKINILNLTETNNFVLMSTESAGIIIFDLFGNYIKTLNTLNVKKINKINDDIYILHNDNNIEIYNYISKNQWEKTITIPIENEIIIKDFAVRNNKIFILSEKSLIIFEF